MTTYIIGDIQGCFDSLTCLLEKISFDANSDFLVSVGDVVNRGPKSLETLRYLKSLGNHFKMVLGNHDLHLIAVAYGVKSPKRGDTLDDVLQARDCEELIHWLRMQPLLLLENNNLIVHAGIPHIWSVTDALHFSHEVEQILRSENPEPFLKNMYGNTPECWSDDLSGLPRLRTVTNYLTRMRSCSLDGELNLEFKGAPENIPAGFSPWFKHYREIDSYFPNVFFGHWASLQPGVYQNKFYALDGGCIWGGNLTAFNLDTGNTVSCKCNQGF